jgi:hypothetical protein
MPSLKEMCATCGEWEPGPVKRGKPWIGRCDHRSKQRIEKLHRRKLLKTTDHVAHSLTCWADGPVILKCEGYTRKEG